MIAVEGDLLDGKVFEEAFYVVLGCEFGGEDVEGGYVFVGLEDVAEGF